MNTYRKFKQPFFLIGAISPARRVVNRLSVDENPNVALACLGGVVVGGARKVPVAPLARIRIERHRRLALASGFRLLRSFGLDRLDAGARGGARVCRPRWLRILTITGGISMPERVEGAAMIFKALRLEIAPAFYFWYYASHSLGNHSWKL